MNQVTSLVAIGLLTSAAVAAPLSGRTVSSNDSVYSFEDVCYSFSDDFHASWHDQ